MNLKQIQNAIKEKAQEELNLYFAKTKKGNRINKKFIYCEQCGIFEQVIK